MIDSMWQLKSELQSGQYGKNYSLKCHRISHTNKLCYIAECKEYKTNLNVKCHANVKNNGILADWLTIVIAFFSVHLLELLEKYDCVPVGI